MEIIFFSPSGFFEALKNTYEHDLFQRSKETKFLKIQNSRYNLICSH